MKGRIDKLKEQMALKKASIWFDECSVDLDYGKLSRRLSLFKSHYSDNIFKKLRRF